MAVRGAKPKPTALKIVEGNPGRRPLNAKEPKPKVATPKPPAHLTDSALVEWKRVAKELTTLGILTEIDRAVLAAYCQAYGRWSEAEQKLKDHGVLIKSKSPNGFPIHSPYLSIANKALQQMVSLAAEFGMTPSARTRIHADPPGEGKRSGFFDAS